MKKTPGFFSFWIRELQQFTERSDQHHTQPKHRRDRQGQGRKEHHLSLPAKGQQTNSAACETTTQDLWPTRLLALNTMSLKPLVKTILLHHLRANQNKKISCMFSMQYFQKEFQLIKLFIYKFLLNHQKTSSQKYHVLVDAIFFYSALIFFLPKRGN